MALASLGGLPLRCDPDSVEWDYGMKITEIDTVGGKVVQIIGASLGDMTVSGVFGYGDTHAGDTAGWQYQLRFRDQVERWAEVGNTGHAVPLRFFYPSRNWDFKVFIKSYTQPGGQAAVTIDDHIINPAWSLTLFIVEDATGIVTKGITDLYIKRMIDGIGWHQTDYNGPTADAVTATLGGKSIPDYLAAQIAAAASGAPPAPPPPASGTGGSKK